MKETYDTIEMRYENLVLKQKIYFEEITWNHLSNFFKAYDNEESLSSAIWAAVFIESILKDIMRVIGQKNLDREELGSLIWKITDGMKKGWMLKKLSEYDIRLLQDIVNRGNEVRMKRNRLVHDTRMENRYLKSDAEDINKNVEQIISSYLKMEVSRKICQENQKRMAVEEQSVQVPDFPMFISTITPHKLEQVEFIQRFCNRLEQIGIKPVRCKLTDFDKKDPMGKVCREMERCEGVIVLGLERSHSYYFRDKEGSDSESESMHRIYSSSWLQLESGMAIGMGKPVFVLCQENLYGEGIFDRYWNSYIPVDVKLPLNADDPKINELLKALEQFRREQKANKTKKREG